MRYGLEGVMEKNMKHNCMQIWMQQGRCGAAGVGPKEATKML